MSSGRKVIAYLLAASVAALWIAVALSILTAGKDDGANIGAGWLTIVGVPLTIVAARQFAFRNRTGLGAPDSRTLEAARRRPRSRGIQLLTGGLALLSAVGCVILLVNGLYATAVTLGVLGATVVGGVLVSTNGSA